MYSMYVSPCVFLSHMQGPWVGSRDKLEQMMTHLFSGKIIRKHKHEKFDRNCVLYYTMPGLPKPCMVVLYPCSQVARGEMIAYGIEFDRQPKLEKQQQRWTMKHRQRHRQWQTVAQTVASFPLACCRMWARSLAMAKEFQFVFPQSEHHRYRVEHD